MHAVSSCFFGGPFLERTLSLFMNQLALSLLSEAICCLLLVYFHFCDCYPSLVLPVPSILLVSLVAVFVFLWSLVTVQLHMNYIQLLCVTVKYHYCNSGFGFFFGKSRCFLFFQKKFGFLCRWMILLIGLLYFTIEVLQLEFFFQQKCFSLNLVSRIGLIEAFSTDADIFFDDEISIVTHAWKVICGLFYVKHFKFCYDDESQSVYALGFQGGQHSLFHGHQGDSWFVLCQY